MIRIPPSYLEQIPLGAARLCDQYREISQGVWCIRLNGNVETRIDVNRNKRRVRLAQPNSNEPYTLGAGEIHIWSGEIRFVYISAECGWSELDMLGCKLEDLRKPLDRINRAIWREISQNSGHRN